MWVGMTDEFAVRYHRRDCARKGYEGVHGGSVGEIIDKNGQCTGDKDNGE